MAALIANSLAVIVTGIIVIFRGRDQRAGRTKAARWLRIAALVPLGLQLAIYLLFGIGEMASGDLSGAGHLVQAAVVIGAGVLAWMRPLEGGIAVLGSGVLSALSLTIPLISSRPDPDISAISPAMIITAIPLIVSGALFLISGLLTRKQR